MEEWKKKYTGVENFKVAVMGCVVNGPGESKHANVGISLPGYGEKKVAAVFIDGQMTKKISGEDIFADSIEIIESYVGQKYKSIWKSGVMAKCNLVVRPEMLPQMSCELILES